MGNIFSRVVLTIACLLIFAGGHLVAQKQAEDVDSRKWSMTYWNEKAREAKVAVAPNVTPEEAVVTGSKMVLPDGRMVDGPDVAVTSASNTTQSENSIFVHPADNTKVLNSNNSTNWPVSVLYGTSSFMSSDGGASFSGTVNGTGGSNSGDPAAAINLSGRYYVGYIAANGGQGAAYSTNEGSSWTHVQIAGSPGSGDLLDKNHLTVDNSPTSSHAGNLYASWTRFDGGHSANTDIEVSRSTDDGLTWSSPVNVSAAVNAGSHDQGINVQTGPNGEVYCVWAIYDSWPADENALGFASSTNGGVSYTSATRIISNIRGIRITETGKNHRVSSFPGMAVDISGGPNNGNVYVIWTNVGVPGINTGSDKDIYLIRSTDGGSSWSSPIRVNQDASGLGNEHYMPWITCDPVTGDLHVVFYDDRNVGNTQAEVFVASSSDAGNTWTDSKVSDVSFTPSPIPGLAGGYFGDYLGISARGGKVYPVWTDNRTGVALSYVSPFDVNPGGNQSPVANANGPYSGTTGVAINFSSAGSNDPDGTITNYDWDFGDGNTSTSANPTHTYTSAGTYSVSLTVTDDEGATGSNFTTANVSDPLSYATLPYSTGFESGSFDQYWTTMVGTEGRILITTANSPHSGSYHLTMDDNLNASAYSQNEAHLHLDLSGESSVDMTFWWKDFSDETHTQDGVYFSDDNGASFVKVQDLNGQSYTNQVWNEFNLDVDALASANGLSLSSTFVIKFQQYDNYGITTDGHAFDDISITGGAANQAPTANANGPYTGTEGIAVNFSSAGSSDPDGSITDYLWDFGDGNTSTSANPSHTYASDGTYNVSLTVTDNGGLQDTDNTTATIDPAANQAPTANANGPYSGTEGIAVSFSSAGSSDPDGSITAYLWDFGDGSTSTAANPSHTYANDGTYNVSLTVTDNGGLQDTDNTTATIDPAGGGGTWQLLSYDDFESGWGNFVDGGSDCRRNANDAPYAHQGTYCARIRDNTNTSLFTSASTWDVSGYDEIKFDFWYWPRSMEVGEDFWVQFWDGSTWQTVATFVRGTDFENGAFYHAEDIIISSGTYNFPTDAQFRFRNDASVNNDRVYIDEVEIEVRTLAAGPAASAGDVGSEIPESFALLQNYPNPFNPTTTIEYDLTESSFVTLKVYNTVGQEIATLVSGHQDAGHRSVIWTATDNFGQRVPSGVYLYKIVAGDFVSVKKMVLMK